MTHALNATRPVALALPPRLVLTTVTLAHLGISITQGLVKLALTTVKSALMRTPAPFVLSDSSKPTKIYVQLALTTVSSVQANPTVCIADFHSNWTVMLVKLVHKKKTMTMIMTMKMETTKVFCQFHSSF
jgi:hypothetical protein